MALFSEDYPHDDGTVEFRWQYYENDQISVLRVKDGSDVANRVKSCFAIHGNDKNWSNLFDCIERYCRKRNVSIDRVDIPALKGYHSKQVGFFIDEHYKGEDKK